MHSVVWLTTRKRGTPPWPAVVQKPSLRLFWKAACCSGRSARTRSASMHTPVVLQTEQNLSMSFSPLDSV